MRDLADLDPHLLTRAQEPTMKREGKKRKARKGRTLPKTLPRALKPQRLPLLARNTIDTGAWAAAL